MRRTNKFSRDVFSSGIFVQQMGMPQKNRERGTVGVRFCISFLIKVISINN